MVKYSTSPPELLSPFWYPSIFSSNTFHTNNDTTSHHAFLQL
jgi:hypothetical protein